MNNLSLNQAESSRMAASMMDPQNRYNMENASIEASLAYETRNVVENIRPVNTIYAYLPKQKKFKVHAIKLCLSKNSLDIIFIYLIFFIIIFSVAMVLGETLSK